MDFFSWPTPSSWNAKPKVFWTQMHFCNINGILTMFLSQDRGWDSAPGRSEDMEYALQKPWLLGSTTRRTAETRGDSSSTPSFSVASSLLKLGFLLLNWTFYLLVTNFTCHFNSVHCNCLKLCIKQAQTLLTICMLWYIFCNCLL